VWCRYVRRRHSVVIKELIMYKRNSSEAGRSHV
jgi:hypothetical protein